MAAIPSWPADLYRFSLQSGHEVTRCELTALIGVEELWRASIVQRHLQGIQAEFRVKAVGELLVEDVPREESAVAH